MARKTRYCPGCTQDKLLNQESWIWTNRGIRSLCRACFNEEQRTGVKKVYRYRDPGAPEPAPDDVPVDDRARKLRSDFEHLKPEDFDVSVGNVGKMDPNAAKEKRQEFSQAMWTFQQELGKSLGDPELLPEALGGFIGKLSEQERRFGNRRLARSISLVAAHEALNRRLFKQAASQYLRGKVTPTGYALKDHTKPIKRTVIAHFSDLHLGADLLEMDNPIPYRAVEEARRLEYFVRQVIDYKPQYRATSELVVLLNGDLIDGYLLHDLRDGAPLTEQKVVFWKYFQTILGLFAQQFPKVRVICQPGNHGRDKVRHPGRATSSKWDGHEWEMLYALSEMCSELKNMTFDLTFHAVSSVQLYDSWMLVTHGDTEIKLGDPDSKAKDNAAILDRINSQRIYGHEYAVVTAGHFHKPRFVPKGPDFIWNGALIPPNGHARTEGYINEPCGQWIWEAVEGYPVGDLRFIKVGLAQDKDEKLGKIIQPFRFNRQE